MLICVLLILVDSHKKSNIMNRMVRLEVQKKKKVFRKEIEGLRAVAALLVAIYHIWWGNVSGGVDVFFVVSGFLITTSLLSRYERNNQVKIYDFILHLAKRLFPVAFFVLFFVTIASILWLPQLQWVQTIKEVFASALYYQNWQLASDAVDYLAQNNEASPLQHYWALSIQGQFYIIWPLLLIISIFFAKKVFKISVRSSFLISLVIVFSLSFTYSIYKTAVNQPWAYFDTFTRVWEFSIGGIIALLISHIAVKKSLSMILGWLGLFAIISCGIILQVSTVFPGYAALWPTAGAVFIILAGSNGGTLGVHRLLGSKPFMKMGSISYAFYLWHWPVLIFYYIWTDNSHASLLDGLLMILFSILLAYVTTTLVEKPIRYIKTNNSTWKKVIVPITLMIPVLIVASIWSGTIKNQEAQLAFAVENDDYPGALALQSGKDEVTPLEKVPVSPNPIQARDDLPKSYVDKCHQIAGESEIIKCEYGELEAPKYTIALVGGSHAAHWLPSFREFAKSKKIKVVNYTKSGCRFTSDEDVEEDCKEWNKKLIETLISSKPDLVFTHADVAGKERIPAGFLKQWKKLQVADIPILAVRDNPRFGFDVAACVDENGVFSSACSVNREDVLPTESPWDKLDVKPENVYYTDLSDYFCEDTTCKPVVGNVLVYRDDGHITATYAKTLAPILYEKLMPILNKPTERQ